MTAISILVPWRTDHGHRERVWEFLRPMWEIIDDYELCVGQDPLLGRPFSPARAFNDAAAQSTGEVLVMMGADHVPFDGAIKAAAAHALEPPFWMPVFDRMGYLSKHDTMELLDSDPHDVLTWPQPERVEGLSTGTLAVERDTWFAIGGMDPRYEGWGYEDTAFRRTLERDLGKSMPRSTFVRNMHTIGLELWHPVHHRDLSLQNANRLLFESEH